MVFHGLPWFSVSSCGLPWTLGFCFAVSSRWICGVVAAILLAGVCCLVAKEKAGKPLFTNLDPPASNP